MLVVVVAVVRRELIGRGRSGIGNSRVGIRWIFGRRGFSNLLAWVEVVLVIVVRMDYLTCPFALVNSVEGIQSVEKIEIEIVNMDYY